MKIEAKGLAIHGGQPVRRQAFPTVNDASGHAFDEEEIRLLVETLRSGRLNYTCGTRVEALEKEFSRYYGASFCVASSSGTAAIHIAVGALGIEPGAEVIVPPITDIGTVIGVLYQNAIPVFADVEPYSLTLDPQDIVRKITKRTRAIIAVHLLGNACDMDGIMEVANQYGLFVIEDAAQAYRTRHRERFVGTIGTFGCFSLQQSKHMTAGDGGLTITNLPDLAQRAKLFSDKGWKRPLYKDVEFLAPNYRMTELQAAVALAQLGKLEQEVKKRQDLAHLMNEIVAEIPGILPQKVSAYVEHSYWQYAIFLDRRVIKSSVFEFGEALQAEGIPCLPGYTREPMYMYPVFQNRSFYGTSRCPYDCSLYGGELHYHQGLCPNAEKALHDILVIPWNSRYTDQDVEDIGKALQKVAYAFAAMN